MTTDELRALLMECRKVIADDGFHDEENTLAGCVECELLAKIDAALSSNFAVVPLDALNKAYLLGFNASGEGYNGEFPFADRGKNPEKDIDWVKERDQQIEKMIKVEEGK